MTRSISDYRRHFVTGGAGFVGSHLVDRLMSAGNEVTAYDNLDSGKTRWIEGHLGKDRFRFIEADLLDGDTVANEMKGHDLIWHLGANTDIRTGNRVTNLDLENCTVATWNVLEAMVKNGIGKLVFASSATVYGDAPPQFLSETYGPLLPISLYGAGKLACEGLISAYCHLFGLQAWLYRFANVVGGRMGHGVVYDFIQKLRRNPAEMEILGDGKQEKTYFLVEDCIDGMICGFLKSDEPCGIFNLGSDSPISVDEIARMVSEVMGLRAVRFTYSGGRRGWPGDVPVVRFNVAKMAALGWRANHTSAEAIRLATRRLLDDA